MTDIPSAELADVWPNDPGAEILAHTLRRRLGEVAQDN